MFIRILKVCLVGLSLIWMSACSADSAKKAPSGADDAKDAKSGFYTGELNHGGQDRTYRIYLPKGYSGNKNLPLVVAMHGGLGTGKVMEDQAKLAPAADEHNFVVIYPDGVKRAWNAGNCCGEPAEKNIDDVGFIVALVDKMSDKYKIDKTRVYGTGFSNGAMLTHRIACERPNLFAAIAPVSGGIMTNLAACESGRAVPTLMIQGRDDERIPWAGGEVRGSMRPSMEQIVSTLGKRNSCDAKETLDFERGPAKCMRRTGCGTPLLYCGLEGVGHQWAGGKTVLKFVLGDNTDKFDATATIFDFFDNKELR